MLSDLLNTNLPPRCEADVREVPRQRAARVFPGAVMPVVIVAAAVLLVMSSCSRQEKDLLQNTRVCSWKRFFFAENAPVQDDGTMEFTCVPVSLPGPEEPDAPLECNEAGSVCLAVDTGYLLEQGRVVRGGPDSSVSLYDPNEKSMCRFLTLGTAGSVHGGVWISPRVFVVFGLAEESGFLFRTDLDTGTVRKYTIPASYRKPDVEEESYFSP